MRASKMGQIQRQNLLSQSFTKEPKASVVQMSKEDYQMKYLGKPIKNPQSLGSESNISSSFNSSLSNSIIVDDEEVANASMKIS